MTTPGTHLRQTLAARTRALVPLYLATGDGEMAARISRLEDSIYRVSETDLAHATPKLEALLQTLAYFARTEGSA